MDLDQLAWANRLVAERERIIAALRAPAGKAQLIVRIYCDSAAGDGFERISLPDDYWRDVLLRRKREFEDRLAEAGVELD